MAKGPTKSMWIRMMVVVLAMAVVMLGVSGVRLATIMIVNSEFYQKKASDQQLYDTQLSATRGDIYDANMNVLATSATVWTVYITPNDIADINDAQKRENVKNLIADGLSDILELERDTVLEYVNKSSSYVIVKRKVEKPEADKVRAFISENKESGLGTYIGLDESSKRYYPNDHLASVVLGFVGDDNQGLSGLEAYYDTQLTGVPGRVVAAKNALGADMPFSYEKMVEATPGNSLVLTIDKYVQYVCEKYLEEAVINNAVAQRGVCIAMNVNTGAVLSMAIKGDFDPNEPFALSQSDQALVDAVEDSEQKKTLRTELLNAQWRNKAVSDTYEPGSVFKIVTAAAALEEKATSLNNHYSCAGGITIAGQHYNCHKKGGHGSQTLTEAISNSCNPAFITMGQALGVSTFSKYFDAFGLTQKTGIDLPGEVSSIYHKEENMGLTELASTSFGQTFKITPVQLITAIAAAVNGGYLVQPHLVSEIRDAQGNVVERVGTVQKRQVISAETSAVMRQLLEAVVDGGGGKNAYIPGYRIGGKTGTSQKVAEMIESGQQGLYIASFAGVAPADNPEIAIMVILDEPHGSSYYGGAISAPAAALMMQEILPYLGCDPSYTEEQLAELAVKVPNVTEQTVGEARVALANANLTAKVVGNGDTVVRQFPSASQSIKKQGLVVLYTEQDAQARMTTVPNFNGLSVASANLAASNAGVNIELCGNTLTEGGVLAYQQDIPPQTEVETGKVIKVYFRSNDTVDLANN